MNTAMTLAMTALTMTMMACAAEAPTEKTGQSEDHYDVSCVSNITAAPGSPAWSAALQQCISSYGAGAGASGGGASGGASGGQSCSISTSCFNGTCTCGSGPSKGSDCDGSLPSGPTSCSELCKVCK